jgi:hypothetical protein
MKRVKFERGAIAQHCLDVYLSMGFDYYNNYQPLVMKSMTNVIYNFIMDHYHEFASSDGITLRRAYGLYKVYCEEIGINKVMPRYIFRDEIKNYFHDFKDRGYVNGMSVSSIFMDFDKHHFESQSGTTSPSTLPMIHSVSLLDSYLQDRPAQYATQNGTPKIPWGDVSTKLSDLDTKQEHFVLVPGNLVVIDFDIRDQNGEKDLDANRKAAADWPPTYAEVSRSGSGVHLHYIYTGDPSELSQDYQPGIEVKVYSGKSALRRRLTMCNRIDISEIHEGSLPRKEKKLISDKTLKSEKSLRDLIMRNLKKEIHPGTKPSIDFIKKILDDAYLSGMSYDVTDLKPKILAFASGSTNQSLKCIKVVQEMKFKSIKEPDVQDDKPSRLVFFDVEVYPNLFVICWKYDGDDGVTKMINPSPEDVGMLFSLPLVGFNNRRYDNHILYARYMGYDNKALYELSSRIINGKNENDGKFIEAYNISYTDVYDFSSKKQGLKKFQIELGIEHIELEFPWDEPVDPKHWDNILTYCANDVVATEKVFHELEQDFNARKILCSLSGLTPNHTTNKHTEVIIFGNTRNPQSQFVYTDLSTIFEGYSFESGKSHYRGEEPGEGGYVYSEPGYYENVALLDVASMHPTSIEALNLFGPFTKNFVALKDARLAIKHEDWKSASSMFDGKLEPYLGDPAAAKVLSHALKLAINSVYGLTSAKFDNAFRDIRNKDNIVAKRGALFMIDLKNAVQEQGFTVAHIKTDSIKIPNATPEIIKFVMEFGKKYGYSFEHETTYEKFCLVNDAVYVAYYDGRWHSTGAQFAHPVVYKTIFSKEPLEFKDFVETKQVAKGKLYLEKPLGRRFVGRIGTFVPIKDKSAGGPLYRVDNDKSYHVTGTKGYIWVESDVAEMFGYEIDRSYFDKLVAEARKTIEEYVPVETLVD